MLIHELILRILLYSALLSCVAACCFVTITFCVITFIGCKSTLSGIHGSAENAGLGTVVFTLLDTFDFDIIDPYGY